MFDLFRRIQLSIFFILIIAVACTTKDVQQVDDVPENEFYRPERELGTLFHDVQMEGVFPDSKTFADYRPLFTPGEILEKYEIEKDEAGFDIKDFVDRNFSPPKAIRPETIGKPSGNMADHITSHWDYLTRQPSDESGISSIIDLPFAYVVPGGRFREIYYWDSFFTMQGLAASDRWDLIESMLNNFAYLIDQVGYIPNGNRTYFLGRSQPPFFSTMVMLYADEMGIAEAMKYLPQLETEYNFWMDGADRLTTENPDFRRVVMPDSGIVLNRYWDDMATPRPESYKEDYEMGEHLDNDERLQLFRDIRAACESGWDFSSRWFEDGNSFESISTTSILPVDLNSLLLHLESTLGLMYEELGNNELAYSYMEKSAQRAGYIKRYLWDEDTGFYQDYNFQKKEFTGILSLAGMYPYYYNIADRDQIQRTRELIQSEFLKDGGLVTTLNTTGQQWDSPNGWAPLQWISILGLANYEQDDLAFEITDRWLELNRKVYSSTGKMMEKYNVTDLSLEAGGGEYPTQDGFGWTNGVAIRLIQILEASETAEPIQ